MATPTDTPFGSEFSKDFAIMKKLMVGMQQKMKSQENKIVELSDQVTKLAHVNLKLNADNKLLK